VRWTAASSLVQFLDADRLVAPALHFTPAEMLEQARAAGKSFEVLAKPILPTELLELLDLSFAAFGCITLGPRQRRRDWIIADSAAQFGVDPSSLEQQSPRWRQTFGL